MRLPLLARRLRESTSATANPQLLRGDDEDDDRDLEESTDDETTKPDGRGRTPVREAGPLSAYTVLREATPSTTSTGHDGYAVTIIKEGLGNPSDRNYYTKEALRDAANRRLFEGLKSFGDHPTAQEEQTRPERSIWDIAGYYCDTQYRESGGRGEVVGIFVPVDRKDRDVRGLIESAVKAGDRIARPLIGISVLGGGETQAGESPQHGPVNFVRRITELDSADLVTQAGAGGGFTSRLIESLRKLSPATRPGPHNASKEVRMKPAEMQDKIKAAQAKFREATRDGADEQVAQTTLREAVGIIDEVAAAEIEVELREVEKIVEKPVAASDDEKDQLAVKLREAETARDTAISERDEARTERDEAKGKLNATERAITAGRVLREAEVPKEIAELWFDDIVKCDDEPAMKRLLERKTKERDLTIAQVREAFTGVEGFGARVPAGEQGDAKARLVAAGLPVKAEED